jgi:hypothetical protein
MSTYRDAKRRLFAEGFLESRFVPNPQVIGVPRISFLLIRPYAEGKRSVADALAENPGTVLVWSGHQVVLGVVFHRSAASSEEFLHSVAQGELGNASAVVTVELSEQPVTAYFDFEGAWASLCGFTGTRYYPRKLPLTEHRYTAPENQKSAIPSRIAELLKLPFVAEKESVAPHLIGPSMAPWSQRRSLRRGDVEWRVFPTLSHLHMPRFRGLHFSHVLFVVGKLREATSSTDLFRDLVSTCGVNPFLVAGDENSVLMAGLAIGREVRKDSQDVVPPQRHVLPTIGSHIANIELFREPLSSLREHVSHRYDRLIW